MQALPLLLWVGAAGLTLKYWVDKWAVLRAYKKPPLYSHDVFEDLPQQLYLMV